jgi:hypothetical protein
MSFSGREGYCTVNAIACNGRLVQRDCRRLCFRYDIVVVKPPAEPACADISASYMREEIDRWAAVIKSANIELQ